MNYRMISIGGYLLIVGALLPLLARHTLLATAPLALGVQGAAVILMVWARITFGRRSFHVAASPTEGGLVTRGPYRVLRHPIYAAVLYFVWAGVMSQGTLPDWMLGGAASAGVALRILAEETLLRARYPEYDAYASRTKRILPFLL